jgi:hypothetical protein
MPTTETDFYDTIDRDEQMINVAISELTRHAATLQNRANVFRIAYPQRDHACHSGF